MTPIIVKPHADAHDAGGSGADVVAYYVPEGVDVACVLPPRRHLTRHYAGIVTVRQTIEGYRAAVVNVTPPCYVGSTHRSRGACRAEAEAAGMLVVELAPTLAEMAAAQHHADADADELGVMAL